MDKKFFDFLSCPISMVPSMISGGDWPSIVLDSGLRIVLISPADLLFQQDPSLATFLAYAKEIGLKACPHEAVASELKDYFKPDRESYLSIPLNLRPRKHCRPGCQFEFNSVVDKNHWGTYHREKSARISKDHIYVFVDPRE